MDDKSKFEIAWQKLSSALEKLKDEYEDARQVAWDENRADIKSGMELEECWSRFNVKYKRIWSDYQRSLDEAWLEYDTYTDLTRKCQAMGFVHRLWSPKEPEYPDPKRPESPTENAFFNDLKEAEDNKFLEEIENVKEEKKETGEIQAQDLKD